MTLAQVKALINQWIITNGNREITAAILNPVLQAMMDWANSVIGDLSTLNTAFKGNLVGAINEVNTNLANIDLNVSNVYQGLPNPNTTPPPSYESGDFYRQIDAFNATVALFLYDGNLWQNVTGFISLPQNIIDALNGANTPSSLNVFATMDDLNGYAPNFKPYIRITDAQGTIFTDLATAHTWINNYTDASLLSDEIFDSGVYQFCCPPNSDFSGADLFLSADSNEGSLQLDDKWGLIGTFGNYTMFPSNAKHELGTIANLSTTTNFGDYCCSGLYSEFIFNGSYIFGDYCFGDSGFPAKNFINKIQSCGTNFGFDYEGEIEILKLGDNGSVNLPTDIFTTTKICLVVTPYSNKFNNAGDIDGDVQNIITNLSAGNPNSVVSFDGVDELSFTPENVANKTDTMAGNTASSTKYLSAKGVYDYIVSLTYLTIASASATYQTLASFASDVRSTVLTGFTGVAGTVTSSDSILSAINKIVGNIALKVDKSRYVFQGKTSITGVTGETVIFSFKIPASAYDTSDAFRFDMTGYKSVTASSVEYRTYIGTTANALTTQIGRVLAGATTRAFDNTRFYHLDGGTIDCAIGFTTNALTGYTLTTSVNTPATANTANDIWITVTGNPSVVSEVVGILSASITPLK